jgi:diaminopimelate epimerase
MNIFFNKYHGAGNDFIIIDNRDNYFNPTKRAVIELLCDRHFGIGADGLMLLENREDYDFKMRYFNSDGRESSMCGNGGRCMVAYAKKLGIIDTIATFIASDGVHTASIDNQIVTLSMKDVNPPILADGYHFIDTGSPHLIIPVESVEGVDVNATGRKLRFSEQFAPGGTNVNFLENQDQNIRVRTYERGVESETLSCGTGVTAAAISSRWDSGPGNYSVDVRTTGGELSVSFKIEKKMITSIYLTGPTKFVFSGEMEV